MIGYPAAAHSSKFVILRSFSRSLFAERDRKKPARTVSASASRMSVEVLRRLILQQCSREKNTLCKSGCAILYRLLTTPRRSTDRTRASGARNVGSIPAAGTNEVWTNCRNRTEKGSGKRTFSRRGRNGKIRLGLLRRDGPWVSQMFPSCRGD